MGIRYYLQTLLFIGMLKNIRKINFLRVFFRRLNHPTHLKGFHYVWIKVLERRLTLSTLKKHWNSVVRTPKLRLLLRVENKKHYDMIVVGDGLMANLFIQFYFNSFPTKNVLQVFADSMAPAISEVSTAVVAKRNIQSGISPLGDKLVAAHLAFLVYFQNYRGLGIEKCVHENRIFLDSQGVEQFKKRFPGYQVSNNDIRFKEEGYLFYPKIFLNELRKDNSTFSLVRVTDFIFQKKEGQIFGKYDHYFGRNIFLALGPYRAKWAKLLPPEYSLKEVRGSYLSFPWEYKQSFSLTLNSKNLIYRKKDSQLIFGNSQFEGEIGGFDYENLKKEYSEFQKKVNLKLPEIFLAKYCSGFRSKTSGRIPYWGREKDGTLYASGFWKNGYTLSFLAAQELVNSLNKD